MLLRWNPVSRQVVSESGHGYAFHLGLGRGSGWDLYLVKKVYEVMLSNPSGKKENAVYSVNPMEI